MRICLDSFDHNDPQWCDNQVHDMSNSFGQTSWAENVCVIGRLVHPGPKFLQDLLRRENLKHWTCNTWSPQWLCMFPWHHQGCRHSLSTWNAATGHGWAQGNPHALPWGQPLCMAPAIHYRAELQSRNDRRTPSMERPRETFVWTSPLHWHWGRHLSDKTAANHQPWGDPARNAMWRAFAGPVMGKFWPPRPLQAHTYAVTGCWGRVQQLTHGPNWGKRHQRWPDCEWARPAASIDRHGG